MKNSTTQHLKMLIAVFGFTVAFSSCQKNGIIDVSTYPEQTVFMAQAATATVGPGGNGIYTITPKVEGVDYRFIADVASSKFNIPLGIIRSGVTTNGTIPVSISANTDTINKLIAAQKFVVVTDPLITTELLPASAYTLPPTVELADGKTDVSFNVALDLNFLVTNATANPKKRFAFAVAISGASNKKVQSKLGTTVILIQPSQVILPVANFTTYVYPLTLNVVNTSANGVSYSWNWGDGSAISTAVAPSHVYAQPGTYTVTLTTTGIAGSGPANVKTATVVVTR